MTLEPLATSGAKQPTFRTARARCTVRPPVASGEGKGRPWRDETFENKTRYGVGGGKEGDFGPVGLQA